MSADDYYRTTAAWRSTWVLRTAGGARPVCVALPCVMEPGLPVASGGKMQKPQQPTMLATRQNTSKRNVKASMSSVMVQAMRTTSQISVVIDAKLKCELRSQPQQWDLLDEW